MQEFEKQDLEFVKQKATGIEGEEITFLATKPLIKFIGLSGTSISSRLKALEYDAGIAFQKPSAAPANATMTAYVAVVGFPLKNVKVSFVDTSTNKVIATKTTDQAGLASINISSDEPKEMNLMAYFGPSSPLLPSLSPRVAFNRLAFWFIVIKAQAVKDRWARYIGRAINKELPYRFWTEMPRSVLGVLGVRFTFADLVPVTAERSLTYEIGISAYCDTDSAYPSKEECCANLAWWKVNLYATKDPREVQAVLKGEKGYVGGDYINIDYHLVYRITTDNVSFVERKFIVQRCPQETADLRP